MHNMFLTDSGDEEEDAWFYDSITRYRELRMFNVENLIKQIELSDARSICVVGEHKSGKHEVLELSLPDKITAAAGQEGLNKSSDLKMRSGGFISAPIVQMKTLYNQKKILVSLEEQLGASLYSLGSEESDLISRVGTLKCDMLSPSLAVNNKGLVLLTAKDKGDILVMDIDNNQIVYKKSFMTKEENVSLEAYFVSENVAALCNRYTGCVILHDIRADESCGTFIQGNDSKTDEVWTMGISGNKVQPTTNDRNLGLLSRQGKFVIYDVKNPQTSLCSHDLGVVCTENNLAVPQLNFSPDCSSVVSVSGFDDKVYIFNVSKGDQLKTVFVHDGHRHHRGCGEDGFVTFHLWYRNNTVISASRNNSLQCWQFPPQAL